VVESDIEHKVSPRRVAQRPKVSQGATSEEWLSEVPYLTGIPSTVTCVGIFELDRAPRLPLLTGAASQGGRPDSMVNAAYNP
jgi:hypothetical protein